MAPKSINIAILGAGIFAKEAHIPALSSLSPLSYELKATYSRSHKSSSGLSKFASDELGLAKAPDVYSDDSGEDSSLDALLKRKDIDAVIILLPIPLQPSIILKALRAGKHVLSEKPVAPSVKEGVKLIREVEGDGLLTFKSDDVEEGKKEEEEGERKLVWRIAENFESELSTLKLRSLLSPSQSNSPNSPTSIGHITSFHLSALNDLRPSSKYYQTPWRTIPSYQGGFLLDGGVHSAALVRCCIPDLPGLPSDFGSGGNEKGKGGGGGGVKISGYTGLVREYLAPSDNMSLSVSFSPPSTPASSDRDSSSPIAPSAIGTFNLSFSAPSSAVGKKYNGFDIFGTEGWVESYNSTNEEGKGVKKIVVHRSRVPAPMHDDDSGGGSGEKVKGEEKQDEKKDEGSKDGEGKKTTETGEEIIEEYEIESDQGVILEYKAFFNAIRASSSRTDKDKNQEGKEGGKKEDIATSDLIEEERSSGISFGEPKNALWDVAFIEAGLMSQGKVVDLGDLLTGI